MEQYYLICAYVLAGLIGLCVGSFLNVVIYRLPRGMSLSFPPSHCPGCDYRLKWYDNIPVISYLMLGGKCRSCRCHISFRYTAVELLNTVLWLLSVDMFWKENIPLSCASMIASSVFISVFFIDLENKIIPDRFHIILLAIGIVFIIFDPDYLWYSHLIGGVCGFGVFYLVSIGFERLTGRDGLGGGDVKLAGAVGLLLGWERLLLGLLLSTVPAAVILLVLSRGREGEEREFPFAPFLVFGFTISMLFGKQIIDGYLSLFGL